MRKIKKRTLQDLITCNESEPDPIKKYWTEKDVVDEPVSLYSFIKRKYDYLFITEIWPFDGYPKAVEGYSVSVEQYRHFMISEILGTDF